MLTEDQRVARIEAIKDFPSLNRNAIHHRLKRAYKGHMAEKVLKDLLEAYIRNHRPDLFGLKKSRDQYGRIVGYEGKIHPKPNKAKDSLGRFHNPNMPEKGPREHDNYRNIKGQFLSSEQIAKMMVLKALR